jgi:6-pyruvoyltetrahydropterin/6-carboxytetrahydropterin synthase
MNTNKVAVFRKAHFNAAHRLHNPMWTDEKNVAIYGKCNNTNYHGHNYELIVKVIGEVDADSGYVIDLKYLSEIIEEQVLDRFDHKNLNLDTAEFKNLNPSAENIAIVIHTILKQHLEDRFTIQIRLYETERNFVEYPVD